MAQATFSYEGISVRAVSRSDEDIRWLEEFLSPWFDVSNKDADVEVHVTYDQARFRQLFSAGPDGSNVNAFMLDTRCAAFPTWHIPEQDLAYYDERCDLLCLIDSKKVELVCNDAGISTRGRVMRIVRELATGAAQLSGGRFLHASAFAAKGLAAIITGPREAGKTSLLSYVLANSDAGYLSNDRVLLKNIGDSTRARGMPTIVSIRDGTLAFFPDMLRSVIDRGYTVKATLRECHDPAVSISPQHRPGRYSLSPRQYSTLLDSHPVGEAAAGVLIFPRQTHMTGGLELRRLNSHETRNRLDACLFVHLGPDQLSDAFTRPPEKQKMKAAPGDESMLDGLSRALPAYECVLGRDAYADGRGAEKLMRLLEPGRESGN